MRTTFSIDPEILPKLKAIVRRKREPMRKVLNDLIRVAIGMELGAVTREFKVESCNLKLRVGYDPTSFNSLYDEIETEPFLRKSRK